MAGRIAAVRHGDALLEGLRLRVKDLDFERRETLVREGKGSKGRVTMVPENLLMPLKDRMAKVERLHDAELADGDGDVDTPYALDVKYPNAGRQWGWQYVFPATQRSVDPRTGAMRRHHLHEQTIQRAVRIAAQRAHIVKPVSPHVLRHSFATH